MIGLFVLIVLGLWLWLAIWAGKKLNNYLWHRADAQSRAPLARKITAGLLMVLFILLPFIDQIIAYPKWQQLCSTTADIEWVPGMNEKKAFGREYYGESEINTFTIFPNIRVTSSSLKIIDANTNELLFIKPHYSFSAKPLFKLPDASGGGASIFLHKCATSGLNGKNYEKELHLKWINKKGAKK